MLNTLQQERITKILDESTDTGLDNYNAGNVKTDDLQGLNLLEEIRDALPTPMGEWESITVVALATLLNNEIDENIEDPEMELVFAELYTAMQNLQKPKHDTVTP